MTTKKVYQNQMELRRTILQHRWCSKLCLQEISAEEYECYLKVNYS